MSVILSVEMTPADDIASGGCDRFHKENYLTMFDTKSARKYAGCVIEKSSSLSGCYFFVLCTKVYVYG